MTCCLIIILIHLKNQEYQMNDSKSGGSLFHYSTPSSNSSSSASASPANNAASATITDNSSTSSNHHHIYQTTSNNNKQFIYNQQLQQHVKQPFLGSLQNSFNMAAADLINSFDNEVTSEENVEKSNPDQTKEQRSKSSDVVTIKKGKLDYTILY